MEDKQQLTIAIDLAGKWHAGQLYGEVPYYNHLLDVDDWVKARNGEESYELRAVANLHDILEDTAIPITMFMRTGLSYSVVEAVVFLTKEKGKTYEHYITSLMKNPLAREVKICDTMANLTQSVKENNVKRIAKYTRQLAILVKGEYFE